MDLVFCGSEDNDLYQVLTELGHRLPRCDDLAAAVDQAGPGTAVLSVADAYPRADLAVGEDVLGVAADKGLRLYLEYPASIPGRGLGEPRPTQWERAVVADDLFGEELQAGRILALHGCWYLPVDVAGSGDQPLQAHLAVARVAGYHRAVYGLPDDAAPILFTMGEEGLRSGAPSERTSRPDALVAVTKLSQFVTARYGPTRAWQVLWERILAWLVPGQSVPELSWTPSVRLQAGPDEALSEAVESEALNRSVAWFRDHVIYSIDKKKGAIEGFEAGIDHLGRQLKRTWARGDCTAETAMAFAWDWAVSGNPASRLQAGQILDYVLSAPDFYHDDPKDPAYGLSNWFERGPVFYGDDNARVLMPALTVARLVGGDRWDERILRCVLANLRTTGTLGFRRRRLNLPDFYEDDRGWAFFRDEEHVDYAPHYQAYLWATFLWAHALTRDSGAGAEIGAEISSQLLSKPRHAIGMTMAAYPDQWRWTNGLTQELARMLLPLAFLVRVDDRPEHRDWLHAIATDLLDRMQPCGAIREQLGAPGQGSYGPPASNEAYGTSEATLMQEDGDPVCDLLYTTNYAFLGLHEAAAASGDQELTGAADRLAQFLCRIQVRSTAQPYLDGAWMRSFDDELWEYWGSSADLGWGAWSVESGWTNAWLASVLAMRHLGASLFDMSLAPRLASRLPALSEEMFTRADVASPLDPGSGLARAPGSE